jgi:hypothetical protein
MFNNFELEIFIISLLILIIISMIPLIELKYHNDLYDNIETFNKYCLNNDIKLINELDVKDMYMWNMSSYIYDVENLSNFFFKKNEIISRESNDYIGLNRNFSKVMVSNKYIDNIMKIYNYYLYMSLGFLLIIIIFFISQVYILIGITEKSELKYCMSGTGNDVNIGEFFRYYIYLLFIYAVLFIIFLSIILKKLTELYADTDTYEYIMLMIEFDILLKENKPSNAVITDILKKYSKNKINSIEHIAINNKYILNELLKEYNKGKEKNILVKYDNNNNYRITLKNIEKIEYYNSNESKDKVKNKVNEIFQFIYVYIIFLIVPIYILSISLQGNYIYLLFTIMAIIIFSITMYNIYNTLQN